MAGGFGLGFAAQGFTDAFQQGQRDQSLAEYRTQELKLQQQAQQNAQKRFDITRNDQIYGDSMTKLGEYFQEFKIAHQYDGSPEKTQQMIKPVQGWIDQMRKFNTSMGRNDFEGNLAAMVAAPPKTQTAAAMAQAEAKPVAMKMQPGESVNIVSPGAGTMKSLEGPDTAVPSPRADLQPGQIDTAFRDATAKRAGLTSEELDVNGRALAGGNVSVLQNLGRGRQGGEAVKATRAWATHVLVHEEGLSPQTAAEVLNNNVLEFQGMKSGASALARRESQVIGASTTAMQTAPRVLEASKNVNRTNYPSLNSIILAAQQGTGDENVVRFGIAVNTFVNNYARALGAGSSTLTDTARSEAFANLQKAWSNGQIGAAIDQMLNKELPSEVAGAKMGMREFLKQRGFAVPPAKSGNGASGGGPSSMSDDDLKKKLGIK